MTHSNAVLVHANKWAETLLRLRGEGLTNSAISVETGLGMASVSLYFKVLASQGMKAERVKLDVREDDIMAMRMEGKTLREIGEHYGVSRERIRQILARIQPDFVMPTLRRTEYPCPVCGVHSMKSRNGAPCSRQCVAKAEGMRRINRDEVEAIMALRDENVTWAMISEAMGFRDIRANLQAKWFLFSSAERLKYLPTRIETSASTHL